MTKLLKYLPTCFLLALPTFAFAADWNISEPTVANQNSEYWIGIEPSNNLDVKTGASLDFRVTETTEKDINKISVSGEKASAYFGVEENAYNSGARLSLNLQAAQGTILVGAESTLTFGKGTTLNIVGFQNGQFTKGYIGREANLVFDASTLNITMNSNNTGMLAIVNGENQAGTLTFKNGASFESSTSDPTKSIYLYSGRGIGASTSTYIHSGSNITFTYLIQDSTSGKVYYEVSGKNSQLKVTSLVASNGTFGNNNRGAGIGHWNYSGTETSTLRIADGGKVIASGYCIPTGSKQIGSGLKIYKNGILQLAPSSANNAIEAGGSAMIEATALNFAQGAKLELDLSGLTGISEEFKTSNNIFTFEIVKIIHDEELNSIYDIYKDNVYSNEAAGTLGTILNRDSTDTEIRDFLDSIVSGDYLSTINAENWNQNTLEWFYSDTGDGYTLGFTMEYIGQYVPVPEPSTYAAVMGVLALMLLALKKRKD